MRGRPACSGVLVRVWTGPHIGDRVRPPPIPAIAIVTDFARPVRAPSGAPAGAPTRAPVDTPIRITPWPSELPLFAVALVVSLVLWLLIVVSVVGLVYAVFLGLVFFVLHLAFVAHVRGSAVRLGPDQFPALHGRVAQLAHRMGLERTPETYIMQAGGSLNAFATRFLRANIVVLYSDLLDACGDDEAARDMIIAHELGHIHAGHLRWHWLLLPANFVPFLGSALSRAREYTCDRYGRAGAGTADGALLGLAILAAGPTHGPRVNRAALVGQQRDLDTGWMTLGAWLASHPPLARRMAQLEPALAAGVGRSVAGPLRAAGILAAVIVPLLLAGWVTATRLPALLDQAAAGAAGGAESAEPRAPYVAPPVAEGSARAHAELAQLAALVDAELAAGRPGPWDTDELYELWAAAHPNAPEPSDPFDGARYGYEQRGDAYRIWSSGPDQESRTADDIRYDSRVGAGR